jgi:predicted transcriptional regulator YdeE
MKTDTVTKTAGVSNNTLSDNRSNNGPQLYGNSPKQQTINNLNVGTSPNNSFGFGRYDNSEVQNTIAFEQQAIIKSNSGFGSITMPTNDFVEYMSPQSIKTPTTKKSLAYIMKSIGVYDSINTTLTSYPKKVMNFLS